MKVCTYFRWPCSCVGLMQWDNVVIACQARLSVSAGTPNPEAQLATGWVLSQSWSFLGLLLQVLDAEPQEEPRKSRSCEERLKAHCLFYLNMHIKVLSECRQQHFYEISDNQHKANSSVAFKKREKTVSMHNIVAYCQCCATSIQLVD